MDEVSNGSVSNGGRQLVPGLLYIDDKAPKYKVIENGQGENMSDDVVNVLYNAICYKLSTIKCHLVPGLPYITLHNHQLNCLIKVHSKVQILFFPNIHSKSDKVCGLCFLVSKICEKSV